MYGYCLAVRSWLRFYRMVERRKKKIKHTNANHSRPLVVNDTCTGGHKNYYAPWIVMNPVTIPKSTISDERFREQTRSRFVAGNTTASRIFVITTILVERRAFHAWNRRLKLSGERKNIVIRTKRILRHRTAIVAKWWPYSGDGLIETCTRIALYSRRGFDGTPRRHQSRRNYVMLTA